MPLPIRRDARADLALAAAAFLFGSTFLVVQDAIEDDGAIPFLVARFGIGALVLLPLALRRGRPAPGFGRAVVVLGALLSAGYVLQTLGLEDTTSSVSAFLTYLLVVLVPVLSAVVLRAPPTPIALVGVALAVVGLLLLTAGAGGGGALGAGLGRGELLTLGCALAFAAHIVALAADAPRFDVVQLNLGQFSVVALVLVVPGALAGGYDLSGRTLLAALYTGVVVSAVAFGLQVWGQRQVSATRTALVLLLEPVFAAALGYLAGERLGWLGALGAGVILAAILVSEVGGPWLARRGGTPSGAGADDPPGV
ncbi:MAG: DMT family transporter, partial [Actinomycetota bacterium]|nr:DMT family transporter [Actinomycetota bacterium]